MFSIVCVCVRATWLGFMWIHSSCSQRPFWFVGLQSLLVSCGIVFTFGSNDSRLNFCELQSGLVSLWKVLKKTLLVLLVEDLRLDDTEINGRRERPLLAAEFELAVNSFFLLACSSVRWQRRTWRKTSRNCREEILYRSGLTTELR